MNPATTAALDQYGALLQDQAAIAGQYFRDLQDNGFSKKEAFALVADWHLDWLNSTGRDEDL